MYQVLVPSEHRLDFILQTDSSIIFRSISNTNSKEIFIQPNLQKTAKMFKLMIKSYKQMRFFEVSIDKKSYYFFYSILSHNLGRS